MTGNGLSVPVWLTILNSTYMNSVWNWWPYLQLKLHMDTNTKQCCLHVLSELIINFLVWNWTCTTLSCCIYKWKTLKLFWYLSFRVGWAIDFKYGAISRIHHKPEWNLMDQGKVTVIKEWPHPQTVKELQRFLGFANFYWRFIKDFSQHTTPAQVSVLEHQLPRSLRKPEVCI